MADTERDPIDTLIEAAPTLVGLTIDDRMRPGVRTHLAASLKIAGAMGPAPKEAAPTFRP
ncbi:MAG: AtzG-like protein [Pseudomonadota bacterium]